MHVGVPDGSQEPRVPGGDHPSRRARARSARARRGHPGRRRPGSSISDGEYVAAGATIEADADAVWAGADLVLKVKEPIAEEFYRLREGLTLFTFLHLAASASCTQALFDAGTTAVAYETVQLPNGALPMLYPMSEVAGRLAPEVGAHALMRARAAAASARAVSWRLTGQVVVLGAGVAGTNAIAMPPDPGRHHGAGQNLDKLRGIDRRYSGRVETHARTPTRSSRQCCRPTW